MKIAMLVALAAILSAAIACDVLNCPVASDCVKKLDVNGCETCDCATATSGCPPLNQACVFCPYGYQLDANGCSTCLCLDAPVCSTSVCETFAPCPYGFVHDDNGCATCECAQPANCSNVACIQALCIIGYSAVIPPGECCPVCVPSNPTPCPDVPASSTVSDAGLLACPTGTQLGFDLNGCPSCVPTVDCDALASSLGVALADSSLCNPPPCGEGFVRVSSEGGCCERCAPLTDCSAVRCAEPQCGANEFPCQAGPNSCCQTCCPKLDCSLVDCVVASCPVGSELVSDPRFCCPQCRPTCDNIACPTIACGDGFEAHCDPASCCCTTCVPECDPTDPNVRCTYEGPACVVGLNDATAADTEAGRASAEDANGCREWLPDARCSQDIKVKVCRTDLPADSVLLEQINTRMELAGVSTVNARISIERATSTTPTGEQCAIITATFYRACGADPTVYTPPASCGTTCDPSASDADVANSLTSSESALLAISPDSQSAPAAAVVASVAIIATLVLALL